MGDRGNVDFWKFAGPASHGHQQKSPTADWVRMVEIIQAMAERGELKTQRELSADFLAEGFDIVRTRRLASLI
jgi:hypothetical protein